MRLGTLKKTLLYKEATQCFLSNERFETHVLQYLSDRKRPKGDFFEDKMFTILEKT